MVYANGEIYEGAFNGDIRHGKGKMTSVKGDVYEGTFESGLKNGMGILRHVNGDVYEVHIHWRILCTLCIFYVLLLVLF